ncbi:hypothetical protein OS493_017763 [Desmophyllum pertusum]|uniref:Uncharacterized protein n=1 Tax=Desmophyllum pertusum TaxID=174260 RepID=A0A9W9ZFN9_9CNID|nr:hypothetical protein OS493_017763 [Desmophyllum pertusum]
MMPFSPMQRPPQYPPQPYGFQAPFQWYRPPVWPQVMRRPQVMSLLVPLPPRPYPPFMKTALNDKPKQTLPKPIPANGPISLQGSILVYPKPVSVSPPSPPAAVPCIPTFSNPCLPFRPNPVAQNPFSMIKPCIPSLANPCRPNTGMAPTTPPTKSYEAQSKPILLTRPLKLQGSVYINSRPPPPGASPAQYPATAPCIPTVTRPCFPLMPPRQPPRPPSYVAPKVLNPFSNLYPKPPQPAIGNVVPALFNPNASQMAPAAPHSIIVQLPEISLQAAPAPSLPSPIIPPQPPSPVFPRAALFDQQGIPHSRLRFGKPR